MASPMKSRLSFYPSSGRKYPHSLPGGFGGYSKRMSTVNFGPRFGSGLSGATFDYQSPGFVGNEKLTMHFLNDRLDSYMKKIQALQGRNSELEVKIYEAKERRGLRGGRDNSKYDGTIAELNAKIKDKIKTISKVNLSLDNSRMDADDFTHKFKYELSIRQTVEADVIQLRKLVDDTNLRCLMLESEVEALQEQRILFKKDYETDEARLMVQINQGSVHVDVDAPKGQDLARVMEEMRDKYEKITLKNQEQLQTWHESQIKQVKVQVTESSTALQEATKKLNDKRRKCPTLEIALQSALSLNASMEASLRDTEMRKNMEMAECNAITLRLQQELSQIRSEIQHRSREYGHLEAEITEYRRLLENFKLEEATDFKRVQTKVVTLTQTIVDGKLVSESKDVKKQEEVVMN